MWLLHTAHRMFGFKNNTMLAVNTALSLCISNTPHSSQSLPLSLFLFLSHSYLILVLANAAPQDAVNINALLQNVSRVLGDQVTQLEPQLVL